MEAGKPSRTAWAAASHRATHQLLDKPVVFEDPLALKIMDPEGEALVRAHLEAQRGREAMRALVVGRSRVVEDALAAAVAGGVRQYVLLGAGLDTFAYRNPYPDLKVFEVDHPATQAWKQGHLERARIAPPPSLTFAPVNFENETLEHGLARAGVDLAAPTVFAWLGVTPYLTREAIRTTLAAIATFPTGSQVVFDYGEPRENLPPDARAWAEATARVMAGIGEPWISFFNPDDIAAELTRLGFSELEDLGGEAMNARYFAGRTDGLAFGPASHVMRATV